MSVLRFAAAALFASAAALPIHAVAQPMTLADAVSYALDHSPTIAQKYAAVTQAEHALAQARGNAFPTVNALAQSQLQKNANYGGAYAILNGAQISQQFSQNTAQIGANLNISSGGLAFIQLAAARASAAQAEHDLASTEDQLATTVTNAYYTVVQKRANVVVDEADLNYQNALVNDAKAKEHAGVVAGVDVLKAQVAQAKSASVLVGARADVADATESLAQTIGASLDQRFVFADDIAQPPLPQGSIDRLEAIALANRSDVKAANESLLAARYTRKGYDRELFPSVQVGAAFGNQFSATNIPSTSKVVNGHPVLLPRGNPGFWTINATTTFQLPLVDYGQRRTERANDDAQLASAEAALAQAKSQAELDVRQSYRAAQTALAQLSYARDEARLGAESARVAQLQYQHGLIALSDVIQTQSQSVSAQYDFVAARVAYVDAVVKLRVSLGIYDAKRAVADLTAANARKE